MNFGVEERSMIKRPTLMILCSWVRKGHERTIVPPYHFEACIANANEMTQTTK